eukprot:897696-Rhodomonas_salina.3
MLLRARYSESSTDTGVSCYAARSTRYAVRSTDTAKDAVCVELTRHGAWWRRTGCRAARSTPSTCLSEALGLTSFPSLDLRSFLLLCLPPLAPFRAGFVLAPAVFPPGALSFSCGDVGRSVSGLRACVCALYGWRPDFEAIEVPPSSVALSAKYSRPGLDMWDVRSGPDVSY